jgi:hypothetical protein
VEKQYINQVYDFQENLFIPPEIPNYQTNKLAKDYFVPLNWEKKEISNVEYFSPADGYDRCWDIELPCAPSLTHLKVKLRDSEKGLLGGFSKTP